MCIRTSYMTVLSAILFLLLGVVYSASISMQKNKLLILNGPNIYLEDFHEDIKLVNYWMDNCSYCDNNVAILNELYNEYSVNHAEDKHILILSYNVDEKTVFELKHSIRELGIKYPVVLTNPAPKLGIVNSLETLPTTYILMPNGKTHLLEGPLKASKIRKIIGGVE